MYGITETTVHVTARRRPHRRGQPGRVPFADMPVHLLDRDGRPVPFGVPGEIHVGGHGVAREYLGRPELTAQRFVPDPFGHPGGRSTAAVTGAGCCPMAG